MKEIFVLLVDDNEDVLNTLSAILKELRLTPVAVSDGVEAMKVLNSQKIDLIITDLMMPNMDGFEFIQNARQVNANIPIAVISGFAGGKNVVDALSLGAYNFITKPFTVREIENVIKRGLRLREFSLGTHRLTQGIKNTTEMELPSFTHLLPSAVLYIVRECQWRGIENENVLANISVCIDELINNALVHGNDMDELKKIKIKLVFDQKEFSLSIEDEGEGFDYKEILSAFAGRDSGLPTKRGLFIVNYLMDEVSFNEKGNIVTMVKRLKSEEKRVLH
jgi:CheY-like chemotaxis protein/anti-sigma regulatory factor (Ser/Thr protein kinase)